MVHKTDRIVTAWKEIAAGIREFAYSPNSGGATITLFTMRPAFDARV